MWTNQCQKVLHVIQMRVSSSSRRKSWGQGILGHAQSYFLRSFQAVVQERGSERHFSKKRQEVGLGNSRLARFTQYRLREMGLNLERTLKLYKWVFKTLLVWPVLMNKPHVKGKKDQTLANWTSQFSNCAMNILCSHSNGKRYTWYFLSRVLRNLGLIVKLKEI